MALEPKTLGRFLAAGGIGGLIAALGNLALYGIAVAAGVAMIGELNGPGTPPEAVPVAMAGLASFVPALFAAVLAWGLSKATAKGPAIFMGIGVVFLLVSMGGPIALGAATFGTKLVLSLMHVVAGVPILFALHKASK